MKRKGKRFLVLLTTASLSLNMLGISAFAAEDSPETDVAFVSEISKNETDLSVNRPDSDVPEVSYEPIIIDIPDDRFRPVKPGITRLRLQILQRTIFQRLTASRSTCPAVHPNCG